MAKDNSANWNVEETIWSLADNNRKRGHPTTR